MTKPRKKRFFGFRIALAAIVAFLAVHIAATLGKQNELANSAYARLEPTLPLNRMSVLPAITPATQFLPFTGPDTRWAMCRFDTSNGAIIVNATLPEPGWSLTIFDRYGHSLQSAAGLPDRPIEFTVTILPKQDRFLGLSREPASGESEDRPSLTVLADSGLVALRAPDKGLAYSKIVDDQIRTATCRTEAKR